MTNQHHFDPNVQKEGATFLNAPGPLALSTKIKTVIEVIFRRYLQSGQKMTSFMDVSKAWSTNPILDKCYNAQCKARQGKGRCASKAASTTFAFLAAH